MLAIEVLRSRFRHEGLMTREEWAIMDRVIVRLPNRPADCVDNSAVPAAARIPLFPSRTCFAVTKNIPSALGTKKPDPVLP